MLLKVRHLDKKNRRHGKNYKVITAGNNVGDTSTSSRTSYNAISSLTSNNNLCQISTRFNQQQQVKQSQYRSSVKLPLTPTIGGVVIKNSDEFEANATSEICDNSNDSGLGFEERQHHHHHHHHHHHQHLHNQQQQQKQQQHHFLNNSTTWNTELGGEEDSKRRKMDIKLESEDANFPFSEVPISAGAATGEMKIATRNTGIAFPRVSNNNTTINKVIGVTRSRSTLGVYGKRSPPVVHQGPVTLTSQLSNVSRDGKVQLQIICQPEQQHRARYQTEGSRGAVKDRTGNGFPVVRLIGYDKPTTLHIFIGTDLGRVTPHMFYQACRVSGKNSTPCIESKIDGTIVVEVDMDPAKDMVVTCDCVGILKERNVDVEHRFPHAAGMLQGRSKKKSTRCRMVFRTTITLPDGSNETLQVCSQPIVCTQPPGIPEICKKSLTSCPCTGGVELFIIGKNLLKDTRIVFQVDNQDINCLNELHWECSVIPDKEFLQQTHLVCVVPAYQRQDLRPDESITVKLFAVSSGKTSEPHTFIYTSTSTPPVPSVGKVESSSSLIVSTSTNEMLSTSPTIPPPPPLPPPLSSPTPTTPSSSSPSSSSSIAATVPANVLIPESDVTGSVTSNFLTNISQNNVTQQHSSVYHDLLQSDMLKTDPTASSVSISNSSMILWPSQTSTSCHNSSVDNMLPLSQQNRVDNSILNTRSSSSSHHQLILPDVLKSEVLDEKCKSNIMNENSLQSMSTSTTGATTKTITSPLHHQLHIDKSVIDTVSETTSTSSPSSTVPQETVNLLGVVDLIHNQQHPLTLVTQDHQNSLTVMHEQSVIDNVLSSHHINKETSSMLSNESVLSENNLSGVGVAVDLRMKHHEFQSLNNSAATLSAGHHSVLATQIKNKSIEQHLNHIESNVSSIIEASDSTQPNFVDSTQQSALIGNGTNNTREQGQDNLSKNILASTSVAVATKLDALVNSTIESHPIDRIITPISSVAMRNAALMNHVVEVDAMSNLQSQESVSQNNSAALSNTVKTMLLESGMSSSVVDAVVDGVTATAPSTTTALNEQQIGINAMGDNIIISESSSPSSSQSELSCSSDKSLLTSITPVMLSSMTESVNSDPTISNTSVNMSVHNSYLQAPNESIPRQIQVLSQRDVVIQEQVEKVVAQAQQQVEQVVAQVQQQAVQTVQQAQEQVQKVVQKNVQVVQQAVQREEAVRQVQAVPEVQQAVQQATQEVVQQSVQKVTQEVVQQMQAVQQAVQHAQAAQAVQQVVQQDIGSMLNQPADFVAEASSVLANNAAQEPNQQRLTNAAEKAITNVITNATQDIINNRPISTTTAHAIIATKNILNSVVTQSAQLMNSAMEGILPKTQSNGIPAAAAAAVVVEQIASQVSHKSAQNVQQMPVIQQQHNRPCVTCNGINSNAIPTVNGQVSVLRKAEDSNNMLPQELTSMSDHDLLSYINPSCFDQEAFLI